MIYWETSTSRRRRWRGKRRWLQPIDNSKLNYLLRIFWYHTKTTRMNSGAVTMLRTKMKVLVPICLGHSRSRRNSHEKIPYNKDLRALKNLSMLQFSQIWNRKYFTLITSSKSKWLRQKYPSHHTSIYLILDSHRYKCHKTCRAIST